MTTSPDPRRRFTSDTLAGLDEPVRRYFSHAISDGAALSNGVRMAMSGRIKVGLWLPFTAEQAVDGRSFVWRARVGWGALAPLRVTDRYADAAGGTEGRLLGRVTLFHAADVNTARSVATRAAIESVVFAPPSVLPGRGVTWRAETESVILARFDLPPERPEVRLRIDEHGAIRTVSALRWSNVGEKTFQYIPSEATSTLSVASATWCCPAPSASAGASTLRATPRSSAPRSTPSPQCSRPSHAASRAGPPLGVDAIGPVRGPSTS